MVPDLDEKLLESSRAKNNNSVVASEKCLDSTAKSRATTPSSRLKHSGAVQIWNTAIAAELAQTAFPGDGEDGGAGEDEPDARSASRASRRPESPDGKSIGGPKIKGEAARRKQSDETRRLENMMHLKARRDEDQQLIREKRDRARANREAKFEKLLDLLDSEDHIKCTASHMIRAEDERLLTKKMRTYQKWNENTFQTLAKQIDTHLDPRDRVVQEKLNGSKTVGFMVPGETFRATVSREADPMKRDLQDIREEAGFRCAMHEMNLNPMESWPPRVEDERNSSAGFTSSGCELRQTHSATGEKCYKMKIPKGLYLAKSRPILEPDLWGQLHLQATCYGHFAQLNELGTGPLKTNVKMGGFVPTEKDGISIAGKRRTRFEHNNLGLLQGNTVRGEAHKDKTILGGSSGAPIQDHYHYRTGSTITNSEFPLGKKVFAHKH